MSYSLPRAAFECCFSSPTPTRTWWWPLSIPQCFDAIHALSALASLSAFTLYAYRPRDDCPATSGLYFALTAVVSGARYSKQPYYGLELSCALAGALALSACRGMEVWMALIGWATVGAHMCCAVPRGPVSTPTSPSSDHLIPLIEVNEFEEDEEDEENEENEEKEENEGQAGGEGEDYEEGKEGEEGEDGGEHKFKKRRASD